jgi:hypothetical protein
MSIFERKKQFNDKIKELFNLLKFDNSVINLKGSFMYQNIKNYADLDFYTYIDNFKSLDNMTIIKEIQKIINNCLEKNIIFIKCEFMDPSKNKLGTFNLNESTAIFNKFIKKYKIYNIQLTFAILINQKYLKLTSDYYFTNKKDNNEILMELIAGIGKGLEKNEYMKVLKRIFNTYQIKFETGEYYNEDILIDLIKFFNSKYGALYVDNEDLKFVLELLENIKDNKDFKIIIDNNLKLHNISKNKIRIEKLINKNDEIINDNAKKEFLKIFK